MSAEIANENAELTKIEAFVKQMLKDDKTLRWTHFGTGWYDIPVSIHNRVYRKKITNIFLIAKREYQLYKDQDIETLRSELAIYQGLLSGRSSMISQTLSVFTLFLSLTAIAFSLNLGEPILELLPMILLISPFVLFLVLFGFLATIGADRLTVREFHVRVIVLSHLIFSKTNTQQKNQ